MTLSVEGLKKSYNGVPVLRGVDLTVRSGEIHALLGANGAGKSTLIKCIAGEVLPDDGTVTMNDERLVIATPRDATDLGIAIVRQEPTIVQSLTAGENFVLGRELRRGPIVDRRAERAEASRWFAEVGLDIDPGLPVTQLSNAQLQLIEIAKALSMIPRALILDEPTSALTDVEQVELVAHLRELRNRNIPILYVTHRLGEVFEIADRVSVLWGGSVALHARVEDVAPDELVEAIVHGQVTSARTNSAPPPGPAPQQEPVKVIEVKDLLAPSIGPVSFSAVAGEIVGVYGLVGSGRTELLEALAGTGSWTEGTATLDGADFLPRHPAAAVARGVVLVPSDRLRKSMFPTLSATDNVLLPSLKHHSRWGVRNQVRERHAFDSEADRLKLVPADPRRPGSQFSGGNQQKLVLARWLTEGSTPGLRVMLLDEPTEGVDVGARQQLYTALKDVAASGAAVVVTSSEPEELTQIAHRVLVLSSGRIAGVLSRETMSIESITHLAHFAHRETSE